MALEFKEGGKDHKDGREKREGLRSIILSVYHSVGAANVTVTKKGGGEKKKGTS